MWKDWLSFSRNEQYGILLLVALVLCLMVLRLTMPLFFTPGEAVSPEQYSNIVEIRKADRGTEEQATRSGGEIEMTSFNPNSVSVSKLQAMGVSSVAIVNWMKYREAGGRFFTANDIRKIYGIDSLTAAQMIPYANFNEESNYPGPTPGVPKKDEGELYAEFSGKTPKSLPGMQMSANPAGEKEAGQVKDDASAVVGYPNFVVEINSATADQLMKLPGLGPVLSKRIVDFREVLGGFWSVEQVKEVYGITPGLYEQLATNLCVDSTRVEPFEVNRSSVRHLNRHPYINFYQARDIVEYRKKYGYLNGPEELIQLPSFTPEAIERIKPYLRFTTDASGTK